jgi:hypothetical protein
MPLQHGWWPPQPTRIPECATPCGKMCSADGTPGRASTAVHRGVGVPQRVRACVYDGGLARARYCGWISGLSATSSTHAARPFRCEDRTGRACTSHTTRRTLRNAWLTHPHASTRIVAESRLRREGHMRHGRQVSRPPRGRIQRAVRRELLEEVPEAEVGHCIEHGGRVAAAACATHAHSTRADIATSPDFVRHAGRPTPALSKARPAHTQRCSRGGKAEALLATTVRGPCHSQCTRATHSSIRPVVG